MIESSFNKELLDNLTTGIITSLGKRPGVCNVELTEKPSSQRHQLVAWEQRHHCFLPEDFKNFYQMSDGMLLTWSVKLDGDSILPLGRMELNSLDCMSKIGGEKMERRNNPSLADLHEDSDDESSEGSCDSLPRFDLRSRIFELDSCQGCGHVCLVYRNTVPGSPARDAEIWFLDTALRWHFLSSSFSQYFRLMMVHMGLPQWQYAFTDVGLSPQAKQWFNLYGPYRLQVDAILAEIFGSTMRPNSPQQDDSPLQKLDVGKVFKGKLDKKGKTSASQKKKSITQNKPLSGGLTGRSSHLGGTSSRFR